MKSEPDRDGISRLSDIINIKQLEHENRKFLWLGFVVAILFHVTLHSFITFGKTKVKVSKAIPVKLVIRSPRSTSPYKMKKKRLFKKTLRRETSEIRLPGRIPGFTTPSLDPDIKVDSLETDYIPERIYSSKMEAYEKSQTESSGYDTGISRERRDHLSLREEMLDLDDFDQLDEYKGLVIQDPNDKQNIKGFVYIPQFIHEMRLQYNISGAVIGLAEAFNYYTGLSLKVAQPESLGSPRILDYPVIYITTDTDYALKPYPHVARRFSEYLRNGGFAILDNGTPWKDYTPAEASLYYVLYKALGDDFQLEKIQYDHPIYHCFFDFNGLPPNGAEDWTPPLRREHRYKSSLISYELPPDFFGGLLHIPELEKIRRQVSRSPYSLWGIWLGERLVAVYSDKGYGHFWHDGTTLYKHRDFASSAKTKYNYNDQLKLGVNMMIYGLIQRGGIAKQFMDYSQLAIDF